MDTRRRTHDTSVRADHPGDASSHGVGTRTPTHRVDGAGADALKLRSIARSQRAQGPLLTPAQMTSLGVLLVAAQIPQAVHLPIWVAAFGLALPLPIAALVKEAVGAA